MNFQIARTNMVVQQVRPWHVLNESVLKVLSQIPREIFVPEDYINVAYSDCDIPLPLQQTLLPPKIVGRALEALALKGHEKVLEIGTGTGYVTACLAKLAKEIISVEIQPALCKQAEQLLEQTNCRNVVLRQADGVLGLESEGPYDAIIITGSYPLGIPEAVVAQLKSSGRLFGFIGVKPTMEAVLIQDQGNGSSTSQSLFETVVPALIHAQQPQKFQF